MSDPIPAHLDYYFNSKYKVLLFMIILHIILHKYKNFRIE